MKTNKSNIAYIETGGYRSGYLDYYETALNILKDTMSHMNLRRADESQMLRLIIEFFDKSSFNQVFVNLEKDFKYIKENCKLDDFNELNDYDSILSNVFIRFIKQFRQIDVCHRFHNDSELNGKVDMLLHTYHLLNDSTFILFKQLVEIWIIDDDF